MVPSPGERLSSYRLSASSWFYPRFWLVTESPIQNEQTIQGMLRSCQDGRCLMNRRPTLDMSGGRRPQAGGGLLDGMVQVSRLAAGVVPADAPIRPTSFQIPLILPVTYHASPNPFTIRQADKKGRVSSRRFCFAGMTDLPAYICGGFTCLWQVYPPPAGKRPFTSSQSLFVRAHVRVPQTMNP